MLWERVMPEPVRDALITLVLLAVIIGSFYFGALPTPYGTVTRRERPEAFYALIGMFLLMLLTSVYILCIQLDLIPNLLAR
jgi:hypothetical protein